MRVVFVGRCERDVDTYMLSVSALADTSAELVAGQTLDRYELVYPVARGGMARVWVAKLRGKHGFEKMVALKTILPSFADDQRFRRMFLDEAKIASGIEHVNVAQILDLGEQAGQLYLVMEWVDGDSLQELDRAAERAGDTLPIPVLIRVIADACAGLHAAHELTDARGRTLNVVHRDVSPQNVLISSKGVVKVIDFGVVKARRRTTEETTTGTIKGKLQYMAPEQALGHPVDRRADIWAVGATLYRLLARRPVFRGNSPLSTFKRLTSSTPPEPLPSHVPRALSTIVLRALAFDPERRYASAAELGAALEALLHGPYQTTAREVAATMEQYLGDSLSSRRTAIIEALGGERPTPAGGSPLAAEWESGISQANTLLGSAPPSQPPTVVDMPSRSAAQQDEDTRPLHALPTQRPSGMPSARSKWIAVGGLSVLALTLAWSLGSRDVTQETARARAVSPALPPRPIGAAPPHTVAGAPAAPKVTPVAAEPPPVMPLPPVEPLSVQALPMLEPARTANVSTNPKPAAPKRKVVTPRLAPTPVAVAPAKPKRKVVDDGF
jgi:serine/threonine protein kinase